MYKSLKIQYVQGKNEMDWRAQIKPFSCHGGMQPQSWAPIILGNLGNLLKFSKPHLWNVDNKCCLNRVMRDFKEIIHTQCW